MADADQIENENEDENENQTGGTNRRRLLIGIAAVVGIILLSIGGTVGVMTWLGHKAEKGTASEEEKAQTSKPMPAIYYPLKPPLMVNFSVKGRQRYVQLELTLKMRDGSVISAVELHQSMIRNALILLIGGQSFEELQTAEGKELLRQQCLQEIQRLLQQEIGVPGIEQVLFTDFVMQ